MLATETEYVVVSRAVQQAIWLSSFFDKASLSQKKPAILFINNNGTI